MSDARFRNSIPKMYSLNSEASILPRRMSAAANKWRSSCGNVSFRTLVVSRSRVRHSIIDLSRTVIEVGVNATATATWRAGDIGIAPQAVVDPAFTAGGVARADVRHHLGVRAVVRASRTPVATARPWWVRRVRGRVWTWMRSRWAGVGRWPRRRACSGRPGRFRSAARVAGPWRWGGRW